LFANSNGCRALGEASTAYLSGYSIAAPRIRQYIPQARLIAVLRHPAERAFSNYLYFRKHGIEKRRDFGSVLRDDLTRISRGDEPKHWYLSLGLYYRALSVYYKTFNASQIRVFLYEIWRNEPEKVLRDIFESLDVNPDFKPDVSRDVNVSYVPRSSVAERLLNSKWRRKSERLPFGRRWRWGFSKLEQWNRVKPMLAPDDRKVMIDYFHDDIVKLQDLIDKDLSHWLVA
jgi:hypothetical protein